MVRLWAREEGLLNCRKYTSINEYVLERRTPRRLKYSPELVHFFLKTEGSRGLLS